MSEALLAENSPDGSNRVIHPALSKERNEELPEARFAENSPDGSGRAMLKAHSGDRQKERKKGCLERRMGSQFVNVPGPLV
jgi:hypothetical protein